MWPNLKKIADLVTSTEEILNGKLVQWVFSLFLGFQPHALILFLFLLIYLIIFKYQSLKPVASVTTRISKNLFWNLVMLKSMSHNTKQQLIEKIIFQHYFFKSFGFCVAMVYQTFYEKVTLDRSNFIFCFSGITSKFLF